MSTVVIAKNPILDFLLTSSRKHEKNNCPLPIILKNNGNIDWNANSFLTEYGGGPQVYNIKPLAPTLVKKAYSLNIFCTYLEQNNIEVHQIDDSSLYGFVDNLKDRGINDQTIISHGRVALQYITHLSKLNPEWKLATNSQDTTGDFKVNYSLASIRKNGREIQYLKHRSLNGLIHISAESEYIRDYELVMWLDAINCSTYHPQIDDFLLSRWQALTTLLDITGSRISEVHQITRTMIIDSSKNMMNTDQSPIIRNIPILKGKYKGKTRQVTTNNEDIQIILWHIKMVEKMFPNIDHDAIFVDGKNGSPLKASYLKNYAKKVINNSKYCRELRHLCNHSFRHRFITLNIAKAIQDIAASGSFTNIFTVASNACRKITMHASNQTLSQYIHLATEYNNHHLPEKDISEISTKTKIQISKMKSVEALLHAEKISGDKALKLLLTILQELRAT
ncbi:hypothetical protein [Ketobacter sp.]|uniref:hypothetical protein n=1 Tax=Ketobacter sp. TaxID=2083498 RepID=UPI000F1EF769|nr:hypothetical protein [Ketobacter sp.]RLU01653.1 MAG: site-specific integrase [Ketobacter sp.]